jgi:hypothetical protein
MSFKAYREINKNPSTRDRVKLAIMFAVGFGALGALQMFVRHNETAGEGLFAAAAILAILALVPGVGRVVYIAWMGLGVTMGLFTQPIILAIAYVLFFVPIALIFKIIGRDMMKRKLRPREESYWEDYSESEDPASYFKQH